MISAAMLRALLVAAVVLRLVFDIATPLMPGAFRFDPAESIEAHRTHPVGSGAQSVTRPTALPRTVSVDIVVPPLDMPSQTAPVARGPQFHSALSRSAPERGSEAPDDH